MTEASNSQTSSNNRLTDLLIVLILVALFALLLEQVVRFYIFGADSLNYTKMKSVGSMGHTGYLQESELPDVVYEFKPGIDSYFKLSDFKTNSQGLRDEEYSLIKPEDTFRVAVIGGSFTVPAGVDIDDAYHSILEEQYKKENPDLNYEFINFGVSGYRINNKLATLKHKALKYDPDLILFILDGTQFTEDDEKEFKAKPVKNQFFQNFTYKLISKLNIFKDKDNNQEFLDKHLAGIDEFDSDLKELSQISEQNNVPICIVVLDHDYSHNTLSTEIEKLVLKNGLCFSNTIDAFKDINLGEMTIYKTDIHPNANANQIFADEIYDDLNEQDMVEK